MTAPRWEVTIIRPQNGELRCWDTCPTRERADEIAANLVKHGISAQVRRVDGGEAPEAPEHNGERRRFLCWALMLGAIPPERLTERIVAEVEQEAAP